MSQGFSINQSSVSPGLGLNQYSEQDSLASSVDAVTAKNSHAESPAGMSPRSQPARDPTVPEVATIISGDPEEVKLQQRSQATSPKKKAKKVSKSPFRNISKAPKVDTSNSAAKLRQGKTVKEPKTQPLVVKRQEKKQRQMPSNSYCDQTASDEEDVKMRHEFLQQEHTWQGQRMAPDRHKGGFFDAVKEHQSKDIMGGNGDSERRFDITEIMSAANEILVSHSSENHQFLDKKVREGEVTYNNDEVEIAKEVTEELIKRDLDEGNVNKYLLKIMSDPKSLPYWEQARFENLKRSELAMKLLRKQVRLAKKEGRYNADMETLVQKLGIAPEELDSQAGSQSEIAMLTAVTPDLDHASPQMFDEKPLSDSEQEEIDEQLTGFNTTKQMAEFKARALGEIDIADKIRANGMTHKDLLEYLDEKSMMALPLQHLTNNTETQDGDETPARFDTGDDSKQLGHRYSWDKDGQNNGNHDLSQTRNNQNNTQQATSSAPYKYGLTKPGQQSDKILVGGDDIKAKTNESNEAGSLKVKNVDDDEIDMSVWSGKTDIEAIKMIQERARQPQTIDYFDNIKKATQKTQASWDQKYGGDPAEKSKSRHVRSTKEEAEKGLAEEAVLKIVANIDSTAISADAMKLTQIGYIDCLRKVQQDKFQTLRTVKEHFATKVDKVVMAKDYQIRCQRLIAIESAKKIVSATTKDSSEIFNREVTKLLFQYSRILDLVEYFEGVVKNQAAVVAFQEKIISKISTRLNAKMIDEGFQRQQLVKLRGTRGYNEKDVNETFRQMPKIFYKYEPFEFYGGNFEASQMDKQMMMRDQTYKKQEMEIAQHKMTIEALRQQVDELTWLNGCNENNHSDMIEKYSLKKKKFKEEKLKMLAEAAEMEKTYQNYVTKLQRIMKRDHTQFASQLEFVEMQLDISNAQVDTFKGRIDKYLEVAKQAKSVLRVPRLCTMYHNRIKGLTDNEANLLLEKLYTDWYVATKEAKQQSAAMRSRSPQQQIAALKNSELRPLSKIEETLMDRSMIERSQVSKLSQLVNKKSVKGGNRRSPEAETRIMSPPTYNTSEPSNHQVTFGQKDRDQAIFNQSYDSSLMWAHKNNAMRDSINMGEFGGPSVKVKPMFNFGKAPNTAGGHAFGSFGGSQEGGIFTQAPNRFRSPDNGQGRTTKNFNPRKFRAQNSVTQARTDQNSRESEFNTIQHSQSNWRKQNLMQKAQNTLNEIHETAKAKSKKFERVVASAGTVNVGDMLMDSVQVRGNSQKQRVDQVRHSLHIPDIAGDPNFSFVRPSQQNNNAFNAPNQVEDSMISATSSVNDTIMNSNHQFDSTYLSQHPRPSGRAPKIANGGISRVRNHTLGGLRARNDKFLSNSVMVSPDAALGSLEQSRHMPDSPAKVKCPPIVSNSGGNKTFQVPPKTYRQPTTGKKDFMVGQTLQSIEQRDFKKMRTRMPAYQIYTSQDGTISTINTSVQQAPTRQGVSFAKDSSAIKDQFASVATKVNSSGDNLTVGEMGTGTQQSIFMQGQSQDVGGDSVVDGFMMAGSMEQNQRNALIEHGSVSGCGDTTIDAMVINNNDAGKVNPSLYDTSAERVVEQAEEDSKMMMMQDEEASPM